MSLTKSHDDADAPDKCPALGTSEYNAFIEMQSRNAFIDAMNAHPILRVGSTVVVVLLGSGYLGSAWLCLQYRPLWAGILSSLIAASYGIFEFAYLRYSWGRRRRGYR